MPRVLIADDHPFLCAGVEAVMRDTEFELIGAVHDGASALAAIDESDPDVVVFDVQMPGTDGITALETLRERGDRRPVVLLSAQLGDQDLLRAVKAGVNGIVFKEGAESHLMETLRTVLTGQRAIEASLLERALSLALHTGNSPVDRLTRRERQIAERVAKGMRNRDIGAALGLTEGTVKVALHAIYQKLGVENRTELTLKMLERTSNGIPNETS